jgi:hypothetical protein
MTDRKSEASLTTRRAGSVKKFSFGRKLKRSFEEWSKELSKVVQTKHTRLAEG